MAEFVERMNNSALKNMAENVYFRPVKHPSCKTSRLLSMKTFLIPITALLLLSCGQRGEISNNKASAEPGLSPETVKLADIRIRDPFIVADQASGNYYMYAQMGNREGAGEKGVEVYSSRDLENWSGPEPVFIIPGDFWADYQVWAPEVHKYRDSYYLFVTLSSRDTLPTPRPYQTEEWPALVKRATQVLVSDSPEGPFSPFENKPHTPVDWSSLDGTLYVEEGVPYMVFCHEWTQVVDGTMELVRLKEDLSGPSGEPRTLFRAGDAPWVTPLHEHGKITDGPFLHKTGSGKLLMIWSSFGNSGYAIGQAVSESGSITGPWIQEKLVFSENGGHGMIFRTFEGELMLVFHQPNSSPLERAQLYRIREANDLLVLD